LSEIVVVDNASADETCSYARSIPGVEVVQNGANRGFAAAVNSGAASSTAPNLLILNPDVVLLDDIGPLVEAASRCGIAAGRLVDAGGQTQSGFTIRRFPSALALSFEALGINAIWRGNPVNRSYRYLDKDLLQPGPVEQPAGAFLLIRRDVFESVGGFDESYSPVWFEDVDFCRRVAMAGFMPWYESNVRARHIGGHSVAQIDPGVRSLYWYRNLLRYAGKYLPRRKYRAVVLAVAAGAVLRMIARSTVERSGRPVATYGRIFRLAFSNLPGNTSQYQRDEDPGSPHSVLPGTLRN
jgi:GT2 family glycosyltransferase